MAFMIWRGCHRHQVHVYTRYGIMKWPLLFGGGMSVPSACVDPKWNYEMAFMIWRGYQRPKCMCTPGKELWNGLYYLAGVSGCQV